LFEGQSGGGQKEASLRARAVELIFLAGAIFGVRRTEIEAGPRTSSSPCSRNGFCGTSEK